MDFIIAWKVIKVVFGLGALGIAAGSIFAVWRLRGILNWQRSLRNEMKIVMNEAETAQESRKQALKLIFQACQQVKESTSADIKEMTKLSGYVRSIAACYHPDSERPEQQIRIGRLLHSARQSIDRLDRILYRPGFKKLQRVRIRHIRQALEWYDRLRKNKLAELILRFYHATKNIYWLRLIVIPDPFAWLAFFSNRLTMLVLVKCLMMDIYLFIGKMSIDTYESTEGNDNLVVDFEKIENTLDEINLLKPSDVSMDDPQIFEIRDRNFGLDRILISTPDFADLKKAVWEAAEVIARRHFPDAEYPLEEAALGPLLKRSQSWLNSICESENLPFIKRLHGIKLATFYDIKSFSDSLLSEQIKVFVKKSRDVHRWIKWPLRLYRWIKKKSPMGITLTLGWVIMKKAVMNFICRYSFDTACKELENVYRQSVYERK